jgi:hypothetical protein
MSRLRESAEFAAATRPAPAEPQPLTREAMRPGGRYNWKHQPDQLIYLRRFNGWHQFKKIGDPRDVWCEVLDADLHMLEETAPAPAPPPAGGERDRYEFVLAQCREAQDIAASRGWALNDIATASTTDPRARKIATEALLSTPSQPAAQQEPLFWYRPRSDGLYEGPIHNAQIERARKESGRWVPLYTQAGERKPLTDEPIEAAEWERECDDTDTILRALGLDPARCRTDGGSLKVQMIVGALAKPAAAPEGWQLVPVEPTEAMWSAGRDPVMFRELKHYRPASLPVPAWQRNPDGTVEKDTSKGTTAVHVWRAMLAAAPGAPTAPAPTSATVSEPRDQHFGGSSYEASMLRDILARIHGDGGHYVSQHGLDAAIDSAHQLVADWRAAEQGKGERALPERDKSRPAKQQGLFNKFNVSRTDGSDAPGGKHHGCEYFVMDATHDRYATRALRAYADAVSVMYPQLAEDMRKRYRLDPPDVDQSMEG